MMKKLIMVVLFVFLSNIAMAGEQTEHSTANINIPDRGHASMGIGFAPDDFPSDATITSIDVYYGIIHTYSGDLIVKIEHPDGTEYTLRNRQGGSSNDPSDTVTGITSFNGKHPEGLWNLNVSDNAGGDIGYIDELEVTVHYTTNSGNANEPISSLTPDTQWTTPVISNGKYDNNLDVSQTLYINGASSLNVSVVGNTERNYDYVYIYNETGALEKKLHGAILENFTVQGSSIVARLVTDYSVTKSGVTVTITNAGNNNAGNNIVTPIAPTVSSISESMVSTDDAVGDHAMYMILEVNKPQLNFGLIDRWQLKFSVPNGFYIAEIIPIKSNNDKWEKIGSSVVMLVAGETVPGFGLSSSIADIYKQIRDIYDDETFVKTISFEGGVESFSSTKMLLEVKSTNSSPVQNWDFSTSGWYARTGETWSILPGSAPSTPPN